MGERGEQLLCGTTLKGNKQVNTQEEASKAKQNRNSKKKCIKDLHVSGSIVRLCFDVVLCCKNKRPAVDEKKMNSRRRRVREVSSWPKEETKIMFLLFFILSRCFHLILVFFGC